MTSPSENPLCQFAQWYARRGWPVLALHTPVDGKCSCGKECGTPGKHPRWHDPDLPHGVKSATNNKHIIERWWTRWPAANVGVATGKQSFDVLDIDIDEKVSGLETLADFQLKHGPLPETVEQITGGGGRQLFFEYSGEVANRVRFAPGLDTRSDGGLVVVPPSLHISGQRYSWQAPPDTMALTKCPEWLLNEITASQPVANGLNKNEDGWVAEALAGVEDGRRDATGIKLAGYFFERGLAAKEVLAILRLWNEKNQPPMSDSQIEKIVRSGSRWEIPLQDQGHGRIKVNYVGTG
jgi:hypothetical protein